MPWTDILPQRGVRISSAPGVTVSWRTKTKGSHVMAVTMGASVAQQLGWLPKQRVRVRMDREAGLLRLDLTPELARSFALHGPKRSTVVAVHFTPPGMTVDGQQKAAPVQYRVEDGGLTVEMPQWARDGLAGRRPVQKPPQEPRPAQAPVQEPALRRWTEERKAVLRRMYPAGEPLETIAAAVNALPGQPVTAALCKAMAGSLSLAREAPGANASGPLSEVPADDADEARRMMRSSKVGARDLTQWFGWPHEQAVRIAAAIRDEMAAAARAA